MSSPLGRTACRNCGRNRAPEDLDSARWCRACRKRVVDRAARWAWIVAIPLTALVGAWVALTVQPTRFVVAWLLLVAGTFFLISRIAQRVAFEIIRARGVPPGEEHDGQN